MKNIYIIVKYFLNFKRFFFFKFKLIYYDVMIMNYYILNFILFYFYFILEYN